MAEPQTQVKQGAIKASDLTAVQAGPQLQLSQPGRIRIAGLRGLYSGMVRFDDNCTSSTKLTPQVVSELKATFGDAVEELATEEIEAES